MASGTNLYRFEVVNVPDGRTLQFIWRETPKADVYPQRPEVVLLGIWSDPRREPATAYARRLAFLRQILQGKTVQAPAKMTIVASSKRETGMYYIFLDPETPTEVLFENGNSLNELLLRQGYAMLDEGTSSGLTASELARYRAAEAEAARSHLGIWAGETQVYVEAKARMKQEWERAAKHWEGFGFYLSIQGILTLCILLLAYLVRREPVARSATLGLLLVPLGLLAPDFARKFSAAETVRTQAFNLPNVFLIAGVLLMLGAFSFVALVAEGPAALWGAVSVGIRRAWLVFIFFLGLWVLIGVFAFAYHSGGAVPWPLALSYSGSIALALPTEAVSQGAVSSTITILEKVAFVVWLGFCAARIPTDNALPRGTFAWNLAVAVDAMLIVGIAVASVFALMFFACIEHAGFVQNLSRRDCFWLSLATLFRQGVRLEVPGVRLFQIIEVHIALFLALVGFRVIYALPKRKAS